MRPTPPAEPKPKKKYGGRAAAACVSVFLLAYVGYQAFRAFYNPVSTTRAAVASAEDSFQVDGFMLHADRLVTTDAAGIVDYMLDDGERVEKDGVVAKVYRDAAQAEAERKIREIDSRIAQLQVNALSSGTAAVDISVLDSDIGEKFRALSDITASGRLEGLDEARADFLSLLNEKQVITGKAAGFSDEVAKLSAQRAKLAAALPADIVSIRTPVSGYFVSGSDGYDSVFDPKNIKSITPAQAAAVLKAKPSPKKAVGTVISSYEWYVVAVMDEDHARRLQTEESVSIRFPLTMQDEIPVRVAALNGDGSGRFAAALRGNTMSADIAAQRKGAVSVVLGRYSGLKVKKSEIRLVNGKKGVYVLDGSIVRFRRLDIAYSGAEFVISRMDPGDAGRLQVNDQIIDGGRELYDGKLIR